MPELRHLRYFVAVAEELNFSRAAERLHMAQPPLSVAIRKLEREIGAKLFLRSTREVELTEAGVAFLKGARRTLDAADAAVTAARRAGRGEAGTLRLGYNWSSRFETLPALGQALHRNRPGVELLAEEMRPNRMPAALLSGAIDVAVALYPELVGELSYRPIRRERVVALLSHAHPLAHAAEIELSALADEFLLFPRELAPRLHDFYVSLCRGAGFEPKPTSESSRTRWMLGTWDASTAALLPESVSRDLPHGVVAIPLRAPADPLETQVVWLRDNESPALAAFIELASRVFAAVRSPAPASSSARPLRPSTAVGP